MQTVTVQTGDVRFIPLGDDNYIDPIAKEIPKAAKRRESNVVLIGRTGNTHALKGDGATIWDHDGKVFVNISERVAFAVHGEHSEKPLDPGQYEVRFVQEENVFSGMRAAVVD